MTNCSLFGLYFGEYSHFLSKQRYQINNAPSAQLLNFQRLKLEKKQGGKVWAAACVFSFSVSFVVKWSWHKIPHEIKLSDRTWNSTTQIKHLSKAGQQLFQTVVFDILRRILVSVWSHRRPQSTTQTAALKLWPVWCNVHLCPYGLLPQSQRLLAL